ncbi:alpha-ketoglutarate decarboxylase [Maribacter sp. PR1]|uniref:Alpha-ketoglutarate decarboxylase n=1 Tax=Maribacter cobaltidurans TaxID=1178778 RepID=A0ABU7IPE8_9FLAO|nr:MULTISPECIES: alpha-ketoglutarate decarboxylase [Maribacter]MDC6387390.1 alpha-ketoglutarate decarboxylase [Maribacter sp. PR1]MEE1974775.1 alpha-ketoglutarate decarboxylase [Maribacter cobaltidurans]
MILKKLIFGCFLVLLPSMVLSQNISGQNDFWKRVRYGGSLGLGFFNGGFNASVSPSAIYPFSDEFSAGASLNFNYAKFNDNKLLAYGGSILSLYNPIPQIQLSAELEQLRINRTFEATPVNIEDNYWSPALFIGAGYSNYNVTLGLRYNLLYRENESIYTNALLPFIRVYF